MNRIDDRTVELTEEEEKAKEVFEERLDWGWNIPRAAVVALNPSRRGRHKEQPFDDDFIDYLSDGTCYWNGLSVTRK